MLMPLGENAVNVVITTLDSNVFRPVVRPHEHQSDPDIACFQALHDAVKTGRLLALISETMATLEAVKKVDRAAHFSGPNPHPGLPYQFSDHFKDALALGIRFMHCPRIGVPTPLEMKDEWFYDPPGAAEAAVRQQTYFKVGGDIEAKGVGIAVSKSEGNNLNTANGTTDAPWFKGFQHVSSAADVTRVAKAVAEWADGDSVAAHCGYGVEYFCTRDRGVGAGTSVMTPTNKQWLTQQHGVQFVDPRQLAAMV